MQRFSNRFLCGFLSASFLALLAAFGLTAAAHAQILVTPRQHDRPPGPALSPEEAVARMTVPEGFSVEIVAAEPDIMNPVAMCIDEKGRFWITESFEYPRREPGPGRDRVKVLEDTDGDGRIDKTTIFAEGLNIPSGIAVGYGGVWVANSPDILFMQDTDGDLKADKVETVVTGFGRTDTHELPNSLTWGPDGWLYGLNGVFNHSHVKYAEGNPNYDADHPGWQFTCAMFRIHPRTREFQIFAEGTSNPWGIAINEDGEFFISACVIDHLWHIVETGYYIRQGGPYPPHTWPMGSIVKHKHQKAAYCGITWFDSDAYPEQYRGVLYMGNIHGGCINADIAERHGATYKATPHPGFPPKPGAWDNDEYGTIRKTGDPDDPKLADFLTANDPWFMPVVQKTGPDGCLYILDWYDRYHCYQDANADPAGIDRGKGRLYRVRYKDTPHVQPFDLSKESDEELVELLRHPNVYYRETAQRLLAERDTPAIYKRLLEAVVLGRGPKRDPYRAVFALGSLTLPASGEWVKIFQDHADPIVRAWGLRFLGQYPNKDDSLAQNMLGVYCQHCAEDPSPIVRRQAVITVMGADAVDDLKSEVLLTALEWSSRDPIIRYLVWENIRPLLAADPGILTARVRQEGAGMAPLLARSISFLSDQPGIDGSQVGELFVSILKNSDLELTTKIECAGALADALRQQRLASDDLPSLREKLTRHRDAGASGSGEVTLSRHLAILGALTGDADAQMDVRQIYQTVGVESGLRLDALQTLLALRDSEILNSVERTLGDPSVSKSFRSAVLESLGKSRDKRVANVILGRWDQLTPDMRPKALEILTQRPVWSIALLKAMEAKQIGKDALNLNQIQRVASMDNQSVKELVASIYGSVRSGNRGNRRRMVNNMRNFLSSTPGDPHKGAEVFKKVCGQCHKIYGEGAEVGPDITRNGRNDWNQLLHNVFDPSQVIGPGYQARILITSEGRVLTGLAVEESDQRVVLKVQGGKLETIPRDQIDAYKVSELSMMPEELEKQLKPQEIADLFAFLALDKPPGDDSAVALPGAPRHDR